MKRYNDVNIISDALHSPVIAKCLQLVTFTSLKTDLTMFNACIMSYGISMNTEIAEIRLE